MNEGLNVDGENHQISNQDLPVLVGKLSKGICDRSVIIAGSGPCA